MFRITFFVEDKLLGEAFKRLAGVARNVEHAYVPNVEPAGPTKANGTRLSAADTAQLIVNQLRKHKAETFQGPFMKQVLSELGMPSSSYSHRISTMVEAGLLKKGKPVVDGRAKTMTYHLVK
jgi:hypothetical protein